VGIDIGAKEYIHELIWNLAEKEKKAIILISSDMPEIIKLARRIQIFRDQRVVGELDDLNEYGACDYSIVSKRIGAFLA
jgi:ribose transport system ATP-binding protein